MVTPLRPDAVQPEKALNSPEVLVLNALLEQEQFTPAQYGLNKSMLTCHDKLWQLCEDYQLKVGTCPPRDLVGRMFPAFEQLDGVSIQWAADELLRADTHRAIRRQAQNVILALQEGDLELAHDHMVEGARPMHHAKVTGMGLYDAELAEADPIKAGFPYPFPALQRATEGAGLGEVITFAARLGVGKSWVLPVMLLPALRAGFDVAVLSAEMPRRRYVQRFHQIMAAGDLTLQRDLRNPDKKIRFAALDRLPRMEGTLKVMDPSNVRMNVRSIEAAAADHQVVAVDHIGLFSNSAGKKAIEDWRVAAEISNVTKEIALGMDVCIMQASQVNRGAEGNGTTPPKISGISGTDAIGQDADTVVTGARHSESVMAYDCGKNRNGFQTKWYSEFLPATGRFNEIDKDQALAMALADNDRNAERS